MYQVFRLIYLVSMFWYSFWIIQFCGWGRKLTRHPSSLFFVANFKLEGWLSVPEKKNKRRHDWKRQYVVVSNRKIFFYNTAEDKTASKPSMILDIRYVKVILIMWLTRCSFCCQIGIHPEDSLEIMKQHLLKEILILSSSEVSHKMIYKW